MSRIFSLPQVRAGLCLPCPCPFLLQQVRGPTSKMGVPLVNGQPGSRYRTSQVNSEGSSMRLPLYSPLSDAERSPVVNPSQLFMPGASLKIERGGGHIRAIGSPYQRLRCRGWWVVQVLQCCVVCSTTWTFFFGCPPLSLT